MRMRLTAARPPVVALALQAAGVMLLLCFIEAAAASEPADEVTLYGVADASLARNTGRRWSVSADRDSFVGVRSPETRVGGTVIGAEIEIKMRRRFDTPGGPSDVVARDGLLQARGDWGSLKLGRAFTAAQDALYAFEPFLFRSAGSVLAITGNYASDPAVGGSAAYQFEHAAHYLSPAVADMQLGLSVASRDSAYTLAAGGPARLPYSLAVIADGPQVQAMAGLERGLAGDRFDNVSGSITVGAMRWMATVARYRPTAGDAEWSVAGGGILQATPSTSLRFGVGAVRGPSGVSMRQWSAGCWIKLAKSVTLYADASVFPRRAQEQVVPALVFDIGLRYVFSAPWR